MGSKIRAVEGTEVWMCMNGEMCCDIGKRTYATRDLGSSPRTAQVGRHMMQTSCHQN